MWLFVWKTAPPFPLKHNVHGAIRVLFLARMREVLVSNLNKDSAYSEVVLIFLGARKQTVLMFTHFPLRY